MPVASIPCKDPLSLLVLRIPGLLRSQSSSRLASLSKPGQSPSPDSGAFDEPSRGTFATPGHHPSCKTPTCCHKDSGVSINAGRNELAANICPCLLTRTREDQTRPASPSLPPPPNKPRPMLFDFLPSVTIRSLPPKHPLQLQPSPLNPRPRRRRVQVPHQVIVVRRVAPWLEHAASGGLRCRGGRVLVEVPVPQEGHESVDLRCWVGLFGPGELVGLGEAL